METELQILRTLCDESTPRELRSRVIESYTHHTFTDPEHQVVFESICALFPRGAITAPRLMVHLTNRGFPDIEVAKYCPAAPKV
jgi:hypothetical protein